MHDESTGSVMTPPASRFHPPRSTRSIGAGATAWLLVVVLMLVACGRATGPERRHLAAVELAREALVMPRPEPKRKALLLRAKEELAAALAKGPRLMGANTTLAGVLVALGESEAAEQVLKSDDELPSDEVQARVGLRALLMAQRQRWVEVRELAGAAQGDAAGAVGAEIRAIARRYEAAWETHTPCPRAPSAESAPAVSEAVAGGEEVKPMEAPLDRLTALRDGWCTGLVDATALLDALSSDAPAPPRLALSHHRLRAAGLSSLGRWADALDALDAASAAASTLLAVPTREKAGENTGAPSPTQALHPLLASLDLDRAVAHAWLGRVAEARRLVAGALEGRDDARAAALGRALDP